MIQPVSIPAAPRSPGIPDAAGTGRQAESGKLLFGEALRAQNEGGSAEAPTQDAVATKAVASEEEAPDTPQGQANAEETPPVPARRGRADGDAEARPTNEPDQAAEPLPLPVADSIPMAEMSAERGVAHQQGDIASSVPDLAAASQPTDPSLPADIHGRTGTPPLQAGADAAIQNRVPAATAPELNAVHGLTSHAAGVHVEAQGAMASGDAVQSPLLLAGPISVASQTPLTAAAAPEFQPVVQNGAAEVPQPARVEKMPDLVVKHLEARGGESSRFVVQLDPPELGRVAIEFQFDGTELRKLVVIGETADAMRQLRQIHYALSEALSEHGVDGGQMDFRQEGNGREKRDGESAEGLARERPDTLNPVIEVLTEATRPPIGDGRILNIKL